jgi:hypothetical protein
MVKSGIHLVKIAGLLPSDFCIFKEFEADRVGQNAAKSILKRHMTNQPSAHNIYEEMVYLLKMQSNWANRLKFAFGAILSPSKNDFAFVSFSEKNSWLYYFVRPFRQILRVFKGR